MLSTPQNIDDCRPPEAIRIATQFAQPGDVVLIAGKGHEDYQEIEGVKHHFNDREEVERIFNE